MTAQHCGLWVGPDIKPANLSTSKRDDPDRMGAYLGAMARSDADAPADAMSFGDLETARLYGDRVARSAAGWALK